MHVYAARKKAANAWTSTICWRSGSSLLRENPAVREEQQRRFQFILVDEYQDTNKIQGALIDLLAGRHDNIMVVGDDSQSIYSWRGAHFQNILKFPERHPAGRRLSHRNQLPQHAGNSPPGQRRHRRQRPSVPQAIDRPPAPPAPSRSWSPCGDGAEQAAFVAQRILELREEGRPLEHNMAVLYRSHFHALELQLELTRRNIPFSITSGIRFFEQAHIKDVAAYLKFIANPRDELAFKRIVRLLPASATKPPTKSGTPSTPNSTPPQRPAPPSPSPSKKSPPPSRKRPPWPGRNSPPPSPNWKTPEVRRSAARMIRHVLEAGYEDYLQEQFANYRAPAGRPRTTGRLRPAV